LSVTSRIWATQLVRQLTIQQFDCDMKCATRNPAKQRDSKLFWLVNHSVPSFQRDNFFAFPSAISSFFVDSLPMTINQSYNSRKRQFGEKPHKCGIEIVVGRTCEC
jgi:hypothetical protein